MRETDLELLGRYSRQNVEDAFAEIVRRHLDLVYSAALRQVRSPQLAEEVAQSAFLKLAHHSRQLAPGTVVTAWLYQVTRREAIDAVRREARRQLREQIASELNTMNATAAEWTHIEPLLDEAMHALDETDRTAVLLRYFENKSLREVGETLGTSDDAAQKRVSRAVERLREFFSHRGVTVAASGFALIISANAVQAAPVGLAVTISTAAALAGTTIAAGVATTTQTIAMTAAQKIIITTTLAAAVGVGVYEAQRAATFRKQAEDLQQQQTELTEQIQQLSRERAEALAQNVAAQAVLPPVSEGPQAERAELIRLRNEVGQLRQQLGVLKGERADLPIAQLAPAANVAQNREEEMRRLGLAASRGDFSALEKLSELSAAADKGRTNVNQDTHREIRIAFQVLGEEAGKGNETAFSALWQATRMNHLAGIAVMGLGQAAGMGNEQALEPLLDPESFHLLPSSTLSALKPAAENGNERAIQAIASVATDSKQQASWNEVADSLEKPAVAGNTAAIDALAILGRSENQDVRRKALLALENAAFNKHPKAIEALRGLGYQ